MISLKNLLNPSKIWCNSAYNCKKDGDVYTIIAGERRWRACKNANIKSIPCIVRDIENKNASEIALIENIQREDLNPIDEANAYEYIMERYGITQEDVSNIVGKSRVYVTNIMRLVNLDKYVQEKIVTNQITAGHGRAILSLTKDKQIEITNKIINSKTYCVRVTNEGAAGSIYTIYFYLTPLDNKLLTLNFVYRIFEIGNFYFELIFVLVQNFCDGLKKVHIFLII